MKMHARPPERCILSVIPTVVTIVVTLEGFMHAVRISSADKDCVFVAGKGEEGSPLGRREACLDIFAGVISQVMIDTVGLQ